MRELLEIKRDSEYFTAEGLRTLTGLSDSMWHYGIFKEVMDNALDAVDDVAEKSIIVNVAEGILEIFDSGGGIPENTLDSIHDYSVYASNKREFRTPTRGFQGNAIKTVIAICYLKGYTLEFIHRGQAYTYTLDKLKLEAGIIDFDKNIQSENSNDSYGGLRIRGVDYNVYQVKKWLNEYYACNPDVSFILNDHTYPALTAAQERTEKTYIHWYDFPKFNQLLQAVAHKDPERTVKQFCSTFAGTQRILSKLELKYQLLSELSTDENEVKHLFNQLQELVKPVKPNILEKHKSGKDALFAIYGDDDPDSEFKYKLIAGEYEYGEAKIPYLLEGFLFQSKGEQDEVKIISAVNNSIPYENIPFHCTFRSYEFCKKIFNVNSIRSLLDQAGLNEASGLVLFINYVSPFVEFTDKAKTRINANSFIQDILKLLTSLCKDAVKEVEKARRTRRAFDRNKAMNPEPRFSKKELMHDYFLAAYQKASGDGEYLTKARQVFYVAREMINHDYGVELKQSDYNTFTQDVLTQEFKRDSSLEELILFERRGFFTDPFTGEEVPLGTKDVMDYTRSIIKNKIYSIESQIFSIPVNLRFNKVLFIEKAGFDAILLESGLIDELGLGIISTQGFGTRAAKKLISHFIDNNVKVYLMNDCDISGYLIHDKFVSGSKTFNQALDVVHIGLTVADIDELGKREQAEIATYSKAYTKSLDLLTDEERDFFIVNRNSFSSHKYRRVEINALTTPELIAYIKKKIPSDPIIPSPTELEKYIHIDKEEIIKNSLYLAFQNDKLHDALSIDSKQIINKVLHELNNGNKGKHWTKVLHQVTNDVSEKEVEKMVKLIKN